MADFDSKLPTRSLAADNTTEIADSAGTTINPAKEDGNLASIKTDLDKLTFASTRLTVDGSGVTQPVSGSVTVTQGTGTNLHVNVDNFPSDADALAQGSTTSGQLGSLIMGAVTTAAPSYTTGQTDPLSLNTAGGLRVDGSAVTQPVSAASLPLPTGASTESTLAAINAKLNSLGQKTMANSAPVVIASDQAAIPVTLSTSGIESPQFNTASALAASASSTQTYSPGSTVSLDGVDASASGQMKIEIQYGTTGSETTKAVLFTSKGNLNASIRFPNPISITNTMSVKVIRTNMDNQAMDVYSTIQVH